jgi:hypothetical protein
MDPVADSPLAVSKSLNVDDPVAEPLAEPLIVPFDNFAAEPSVEPLVARLVETFAEGVAEPSGKTNWNDKLAGTYCPGLQYPDALTGHILPSPRWHPLPLDEVKFTGQGLHTASTPPAE